MDNSFNGLRYSSTRGCLVGVGGEEIHMCQQAMLIFLLLKQNLNKLVTIEQLLRKLPATGVESEDAVNNAIAELTHIVGHTCLKAIPRVGYLLTPDTKPNESAQYLNANTVNSGLASRPASTLIQELVFNSQWLSCIFRKKPYTRTGSLVLLTAILAASVMTPADMAVDKAVGPLVQSSTDSTCSAEMADCTACSSDTWQSSTIFAQRSGLALPECKSGS